MDASDGGPSSVLLLAALAALVLASGFFSGSEVALLSLNRLRLRHRSEQGDARAQRVQRLLASPQRVINTILIGNNLVNIVASAVATAFAIKLWGPQGTGIAAAAMTVLILVFGEAVPKSIATQYAETVAYAVGRPIGALTALLAPLAALLDVISSLAIRLMGGRRPPQTTVTTEEIRTIVNIGQEQGVLDAQEHDLIHRVFEFGETTVGEIMVPKVDMVSAPATMGVEQIADLFARHPYSRIIVYEDTPDNIVGAVHIKDLVRAQQSGSSTLRSIIRPVLFVPETLPIERAFARMKAQRISTAIVLDEYAQTLGMLTLGDIIEEIVGELMDEHDAGEADPVAVDDRSIEVEGSYLVEDLNQEFGLNIPEDVAKTIGGYVFYKLGRIPQPSDKLAAGPGVELAVIEVRGKRVTKVRIVRGTPSPAGSVDKASAGVMPSPSESHD
ncbi:MAG: HlyC/CorC family transporter [Firmicutes bacterium]|nr:HlyC/CorC family transporter [Bacillota bacterium]